MTDHFNGLSHAQAERLAMLAEECAEVIVIVGKILRHGYDSYDPANPSISNKDMLADELADVDAVVKAMKRRELREYSCQDGIGKRWEKKLKYAHHQDETND